MISEPLGGEPMLAPPRPGSCLQLEQVKGGMSVPRAANDSSLGNSPNVA